MNVLAFVCFENVKLFAIKSSIQLTQFFMLLILFDGDMVYTCFSRLRLQYSN